MKSLVAYDSSDEEQETLSKTQEQSESHSLKRVNQADFLHSQPKKKVQIIVNMPKATEEDKIKTNIKATELKASLFDLLPKPKPQLDENIGLPLRELGGSADGVNSRITLPKPKNISSVKLADNAAPFGDYMLKKVSPESNEDNEAVTFFTLSEPEVSPFVGPSRPSPNVSLNVFDGSYDSNNQFLYEQLTEESQQQSFDTIKEEEELLNLRIRKKNEAQITFKNISQKEIIGDSYEQQKMRNVTSKDKKVNSSAYSMLPSMINQGRGTGGRNIMSLAYEAKARQEQLDEQREHARTVKKMVRAKYGF